MFNITVSMKCSVCDIEEHYKSFDEAYSNDWKWYINKKKYPPELIYVCPHCIERREKVHV